MGGCEVILIMIVALGLLCLYNRWRPSDVRDIAEEITEKGVRRWIVYTKRSFRRKKSPKTNIK